MRWLFKAIPLLFTALTVCSPAHAADWAKEMAREFRDAGLSAPKGGYVQPLRLKQQTVERAAIAADGRPLTVTLDVTARQPEKLSAPLFFLGSREPGPAVLHELRGKVVVMLARDAAALAPAARLAVERAEAAGFLTIGAAPAVQTGWFADNATARLTGWVAPEAASALFARSGRDYAEVAALAAAGKSTPSFPLALDLTASLSIHTRASASANVVAIAPGTDPLLAKEYVVVSAEAAEAGAVLQAARRIRAENMRSKRSIVFAVFAPEAHGALGAHAFAAAPPIAREAVVAVLNAATTDAAGTTLAIEGGAETSLGVSARDLATTARLTLSSPGAPGGVSPYGFLEAGAPALSLTFGGRADADYLLTLALQVADNDAHPGWMRGSPFAPRAPEAQQVLTAPVDMPVGRRPQRGPEEYARVETLRLR